jgi:hypothetical protein
MLCHVLRVADGFNQVFDSTAPTAFTKMMKKTFWPATVLDEKSNAMGVEDGSSVQREFGVTANS